MRVYSVGVSVAPAGSVVVEEMRPDWFLQVEALPLVDGAPRSFGAELLPPSCPRVSRSAGLDFPSAGFCGTAVPVVQFHPRDVDLQRRDDDGVFRRRSFEIGDRRLPAGSGELLIQGVKRSLSGGAPPTALRLLRRGQVAQGRSCIFVYFRGPLCNCPL